MGGRETEVHGARDERPGMEMAVRRQAGWRGAVWGAVPGYSALGLKHVVRLLCISGFKRRADQDSPHARTTDTELGELALTQPPVRHA